MKLNNLREGLFCITLTLVLVSYEQLSSAQSTRTGFQIRSQTGACLDANTGRLDREVYMRPCDNGSNPNLKWDLVTQGTTILLKTQTTGNCLDARAGREDGRVYLRPCGDFSSTSLKWYRTIPSHLITRTTNYCLDANGGILGRPAYLRRCDGGLNINLKWNFRYPDD
jgi:hypothetical protein